MPLEIAKHIARRFLSQQNMDNTYNTQLAYEALLLMADQIDGVRAAVDAYMQQHAITHDSVLDWRSQQFHDLAYAWFTHTQQLEQWTVSHLQTTDAWMDEGPKRSNGALIHNCIHDPVGSLIDMQQAYCLRLARAAQLSGEQQYIDECMLQYRTYRDELRSPTSGCYHQGRGWLPDDGLSPAPWSRGQGWMLHGMVHCLPLLTAWPDAHEELQCFTRELLDALVPLQGPGGLWHQLVDEPDDSFPDSSGSALILEAYVLFQQHRSLTDYNSIIAKAWAALHGLVDDDGVVDQACKGPGTIWETGPWRHNKAPTGDPHGVFSMLFACAAMSK